MKSFRVFDLEEHKMFYEGFALTNDGELILINHDGSYSSTIKDRYIIMFSTGKTTCQNQEIFAEDFIRYDTGYECFMSKLKNQNGTVITEKFMLIVPVYLTILEDVAEEIYAAEAIRCGDVPDEEGWQPIYTIYWKNKKKINWKKPEKICNYGIKYNRATGKFN